MPTTQTPTDFEKNLMYDLKKRQAVVDPSILKTNYSTGNRVRKMFGLPLKVQPRSLNISDYTTSTTTNHGGRKSIKSRKVRKSRKGRKSRKARKSKN